MNEISSAVQYILGLGPPVMMPIIVTILGLALRQGFTKSFRAGLTVGVGFIAVGLVINLLIEVVGPNAMAFAAVLGKKLDILDVGWPMGAAVSFASPIAAALIPAVFFLNIVLVIVRFTRTVDVDLWNYWHFIYTGALVQAATGSMALGILAACLTAAVIFKLADWTAPAVEHHFGLPGISLPHTETVNWAPLMYALDRVMRKVPVIGRLEADPGSIKRRLGLVGEPILMGALMGLFIGALGSVPLFRQGEYGTAVRNILRLSITMSAVLVVLPKVVAILMEGLIPISEGARDYLQKRFPGRDLLIGLDAAVVIGNPANMAVALLCVPIALLLAVVLPGNRMLPFADLAALPFYILWGVAAARGNLVRGLLNAVVVIAGILWIGTSLGPLTTEVARAAHLGPPKGVADTAADYQLWSGVALGSHIVPWIVVQLFQPGTFVIGVVAAVIYGLAWFWMRREIVSTYAAEIEKARVDRAAQASEERR
ncbi:MAG: PTS transporter subunit IIC [Polyangiaceae bacterium]